MNSVVSASDYTCKVCSAGFGSMAAVLRHELSHVVGGGGNGPTTGRKRHRNAGRPNNNKKRRKGSKKIGKEVDPVMAQLENEVRGALRNCREGSELNVLCRIFQNDPSVNSQNFMQVSNDLRGVFESSEICRNSEIHPFGSMITGMAFKDSDIDFFVTPAVRGPFKQHFNVVFRLVDTSRHFNHVFPIRAARVPIIKCRHKATGLNLDINMSSCHGVFSSRFIAKMFTFDQRIHPIMFIIKIWAKSWGFTNTNRMSNYCLLILVVYYLQACRNPILPPLKQFMLNTTPQIADGINFAFNERYPNKTTNRCNIRELVEGFFKFYSDFPFRTHVICPYLGKQVNREEFADDSIHFPEYRRQIKMMDENYATLEESGFTDWCRDIRPGQLEHQTTLVIQDPFSLNTNIARGLRAAVFNVFHKHVLYARRICNDRNDTSASMLLRLFYEVPTEEPGSLISMAVPGKMAESGAIKAANLAKAQQTTSVKTAKANELTCRLTPVETELFYTRLYLRNMDPGKTHEKIEIDRTWSENMIQFLRQIFVDLYKINVKEKSGKRGKYHIRGQVEATVDTWTQRRTDTKKEYAAFLREQADFVTSVIDQRIGQEALFTGHLCIEANTKDFSEVNIKMQPADVKKKNVSVFFRDLTTRARTFLRAYFEKLATEATNAN